MLKEGMYIRCGVDDELYPRDFAIGRIKSIDNFSETASIEFFDIDNVGIYFIKPNDRDVSIKKIEHIKIRKDSTVIYKDRKYYIQECKFNKVDKYYYYYIVSQENEMEFVCENEIETSYNNGKVSPLQQLMRYEFQNPRWYFGRSQVSRTMHIINNSLYGFSEITGCKILLKTHQLRTIMRCLQEDKCRNMIADEVGMGKTIEALSVLKVYLNNNFKKDILIVVPDSLVEQWRTELAFKFNILEGIDKNDNYIMLMKMSGIESASIMGKFDFIIADEVHKYLGTGSKYNALLELSKKCDNILMLSATPVQRRKEEYHKLLTLIQPQKYENMTIEKFNSLLELQGKLIRRVYNVLESLDSYLEEIEDSEYQHTDTTEELFEDIYDELEVLVGILKNEKICNMFEKLDYYEEDFGVKRIQDIISFICEKYQFEKCIIRNRRISNLEEDLNERELVDISYDIQTTFNNTEYRVYCLLSDWIESLNLNYDVFLSKFKRVVSSFFSSARAFKKELNKIINIYSVPEELLLESTRWVKEENENIKQISEYLNDPIEFESRIVNIIDFIDQEAYGKKVLIFTDFKETFELYKSILESYFGKNKCAFFQKDMDTMERELNAYRFETDQNYEILLSDKSGGEGRNFQNADIILNIDIPWSANELEQRIGRLDRIGRKKGLPVTSAVCYAKLSLEEDLFRFWNEGLNIFNKSQSGLEIIMNDIDEKLIQAVCSDFKYGLNNVIDSIIEELDSLNRIVKEERYFDIGEYKYQTINQIMDETIRLYNNNESELFSTSMMKWASLSGFNGVRVDESSVRFDAYSFSINSAYNSLFIPPDIKGMIEDKVNQIRNKVRTLNLDKAIYSNNNYIQGTFDRNSALRNDYIHFFAPGDEIFNSIVNNAINSYKGTCAAFNCYGDINWTGFIFTWILEPDENILLENGISTHIIDKYRGFMSSEQFQCCISLKSDSQYSESEIIKSFNNVIKEGQNVTHWGRRSNGGRGKKSNIEKFIGAYPEDVWKNVVSAAYRKSQEDLKKKAYKKLGNKISMLKSELNYNSSDEKAVNNYYGDLKEVEINERNDLIEKCFSKPKRVLDSVCYVRIIKND